MVKKIIGLIIILIIIFLFFIFFSLDSLVKKGITHYGSEALGVPVTVGHLSLSILNGKGSIEDFEIANPKGYKSPYVMKVGKLSFSVKPKTLFSDHIVINSIKIDSLDVNYEVGPKGNNIGQLRKNVKSSVDSGAKAAPEDKPKAGAKAKPQKTVTLYLFSVTNSSVTGDLGVSKKTIKLPDIVLKDLGTDKPLPVAQLVQILLNKLTSVISQQGVSGLAQSFLGGSSDSGSTSGSGLGGLVPDKLHGAVKNLGGKLKGLLS
jgi:uncharacterized protein involved in outer membrane biogenesis